MSVHVGQLAQVNYKEPENGSSWGYGIITAVYDDMFLVQGENGVRTMQHVGTTENIGTTSVDNASTIIPLYSGGKPALAKKTLFGQYKFPKN